MWPLIRPEGIYNRKQKESWAVDSELLLSLSRWLLLLVVNNRIVTRVRSGIPQNDRSRHWHCQRHQRQPRHWESLIRGPWSADEDQTTREKRTRRVTTAAAVTQILALVAVVDRVWSELRPGWDEMKVCCCCCCCYCMWRQKTSPETRWPTGRSNDVRSLINAFSRIPVWPK